MALDNDGPEPITKTVLPWIISLIFSMVSVFFKIESNIAADSLSFFSVGCLFLVRHA